MLSRYYATPYFFSSLALQRTRYAIVELTKVYRQSDKRFLDILNKVRENRADAAVLSALNSRYIPNFKPRKEDGYIRLTTHNWQAQRINDHELELLPGKPYTYTATIEGKYPEMLFPTDETLTLKTGAQVMFVKNDSSADKAYYNGMIGTIAAIDAEGFTVTAKDTGENIRVQPEQWDNTRYVLNEKTNEISEEVEVNLHAVPREDGLGYHRSQESGPYVRPRHHRRAARLHPRTDIRGSLALPHSGGHGAECATAAVGYHT